MYVFVLLPPPPPPPFYFGASAKNAWFMMVPVAHVTGIFCGGAANETGANVSQRAKAGNRKVIGGHGIEAAAVMIEHSIPYDISKFAWSW